MPLQSLLKGVFKRRNKKTLRKNNSNTCASWMGARLVEDVGLCTCRVVREHVQESCNLVNLCKTQPERARPQSHETPAPLKSIWKSRCTRTFASFATPRKADNCLHTEASMISAGQEDFASPLSGLLDRYLYLLHMNSTSPTYFQLNYE